MLRIIVDSSSSITQEEAKQLGIDILPLRVCYKGIEYRDGVDIDSRKLYELMEEKGTFSFPKTSLPYMNVASEMVENYTKNGDQVLLITISSKLSSTFSALTAMFASNSNVVVYDSKSAVGGIRLLALEAIKNKDKDLHEIVKILDDLSSRVVIIAVPETLDYLLRGGRLKRSAWMIGKILKIIPVITFNDGALLSLTKVSGKMKGMFYICDYVNKYKVDVRYPVIGSYTRDKENLDRLGKMLLETNGINLNIEEDMSASIAAHWGPGAFGVVYIKTK